MKRRPARFFRIALLFGVSIFVVAAFVGTNVALAHLPSDTTGDGWGNYSWVCTGGDGTSSASGRCFNHHTNADARFFFESTVINAGYSSGLTTGYTAWDQSYSHQFNFVRELSDTSTNANVSVVSNSITLCGKATAVACVGMASDSGGHLVEGTATIKFHDDISAALLDDVAAHEFGHYAGQGHSDESYATMWGSVTSGQSSLAYEDRVGRCMIYGHAHGYWGGCNHA